MYCVCVCRHGHNRFYEKKKDLGKKSQISLFHCDSRGLRCCRRRSRRPNNNNSSTTTEKLSVISVQCCTDIKRSPFCILNILMLDKP